MVSRVYVGEQMAAGYVEAVAVDRWRRQVSGRAVMRAIGDIIAAPSCSAVAVDGAPTASTSVWDGSGGADRSFVVEDGAPSAHRDEDDGIMVLRPPGREPVDLRDRPIAVDARSGDDW